jgi:hypothetical protein
MDEIQYGGIVMSFDPRTIGKPVYRNLTRIRHNQETNQTTGDSERTERIKQQKNQAVELYTYLSTWGLLRLKAEQRALSQDGKKDVVEIFFAVLGEISGRDDLNEDSGLDVLIELDVDDYLGLTGLGLLLAKEFSFWANTVYFDIKEVN